MAKNILGIVFVVLGVFFIAYGVLGNIIIPSPDGSKTQKNVVTCDITINNLPLGTAEIGNYQCRKERQCLFGFSVVQLGIFGQKGMINLISNDATISKQYDTGFYPGTVTKSLSICTGGTNGKLQLVDDRNNVIMERGWSV